MNGFIVAGVASLAGIAGVVGLTRATVDTGPADAVISRPAPSVLTQHPARVRGRGRVAPAAATAAPAGSFVTVVATATGERFGGSDGHRLGHGQDD